MLDNIMTQNDITPGWRAAIIEARNAYSKAATLVVATGETSGDALPEFRRATAELVLLTARTNAGKAVQSVAASALLDVEVGAYMREHIRGVEPGGSSHETWRSSLVRSIDAIAAAVTSLSPARCTS